MTASFATGGRGKRYGQYRCAQKNCRAVNVRKETVEADFLRLLTEIQIETTPLLQKFRRRILDEWQVRHAEVIAAQGLIKARAERGSGDNRPPCWTRCYVASLTKPRTSRRTGN